MLKVGAFNGNDLTLFHNFSQTGTGKIQFDMPIITGL